MRSRNAGWWEMTTAQPAKSSRAAVLELCNGDRVTPVESDPVKIHGIHVGLVGARPLESLTQSLSHTAYRGAYPKS